jgi:hypothetical protein
VRLPLEFKVGVHAGLRKDALAALWLSRAFCVVHVQQSCPA